MSDSLEGMVALIAALPEGLLLVDSEGRIELTNGQADSMFGYGQGELAGRSVEELLPEWAGGLLEAVPGRRNDGSEFPVDLSLREMETARGRSTIALVRDVTGRVQAEEAQRAYSAGLTRLVDEQTMELRAREARYSSLFQSIDEGFCIIQLVFDDQDRPVDYVFLEINPAFEGQTGLVDAVGKSMRELAPDHESHWFEMYGRVAVEGEPVRFQNRAEQLNRWYDVYAFRIGEPEERQVALLFSDITEKHEIESALREAKEKADEANQAKTTFFSNVSHEFRTPLTLMLGPLEGLMSRPQVQLHESDLEQVALAHRNALRLLKLVNTLLDFSRIEAGRVEATFEPTDLAEYTADLVSVFRSAVESVGLDLHFDCPILMEPVFVDRAMWEKIVLNLLSNALKFTFEGSIDVSLRASEAEVTLSVRDSGVGIPAEELPRVFERFHRIEGQRSRTHEGTGIGLALVEELVKIHGGEIHVESTLSQGAVFQVRIPLGHAHLPEHQVRTVEPTGATASAFGAVFVEEAQRWLPNTSAVPSGAVHAASVGGTVLLVDDNGDMRAYVAGLLAPSFDVIDVADGMEALDVLEELKPDLVLTDIMMPNLDGFGLLKVIRANPTFSSIPVVLVSARAGEEARIEGLDAGADDYLIKPFSAHELVARVGTHVRLHREREAINSRLTELNSELRLRLEELDEAYREAEAFNHTVSHDLRSPLRVIASYSQILKADYGDRLDGGATDLLDRLVGASKKIAMMLDELLKLSRVSRQEMARQKVNISDLAKEIAEELKVHEWPEEPRFEVEPDLAAEADPTLMRLVLSNLMHNACKYSPTGARVSIGREASDHGPAFFVRDRGIGFDPQYAEKVFAPFERLVRESEYPGTGLGLANVRRIVERHGGRTWAQSQPGQGSTFYFTVQG